MPNHVHLIAVPDNDDSLAKAIGEAHRRCTRDILISGRVGVAIYGKDALLHIQWMRSIWKMYYPLFG